MAKDIDATPRNSESIDDEMRSLKIQDTGVDRAEDIQVDSDQSKFSAMLGILRKVAGVSDVINLRLSLPSQLLDPIPNLEYWNYMDRPEYFVEISESDDEVERMLAVLAWWFSKLLKHSGKVLKPFNSVLGEQFFCRWNVNGDAEGEGTVSSGSTTVSISEGSTTNNGGSSEDAVVVEYITEQVSHHPPVSAFIYRCKERGIEAAGYDHISAKFTGLSATVTTGAHCNGIFITLQNRGNEMYQCIHPMANIVGWLRGSIKVQFAESSYIVCEKSGLAALVEFKEERWFGKNKENVSGKVFRYDAVQYGEQIAQWKLKDIPKSCAVVATFGGDWDRRVAVRRTDGSCAERTLVDLTGLEVVDKTVRPVDEQGEMESRRIWGPVAAKMLQGKYGEATRLKRGIEEGQRALAAARKERGEEFAPALFKKESKVRGKPELLDDAPVNV
ncbi:hypothetical protein LPJ53_005422 [Coemansia erecta]|uniref:Oxysterol-binding protein n=1 Tax=Coemansia erecta TaxID=147472 RepID=A0A9W7XVT4_9FUNG|nr:hypothetical protein LPJ53_005422 [Coemansia erecta]